MWKSSCRIGLAFVATATAVFAGSAEPYFSRLDRYETPVPYAGIRSWHLTYNLGPTGARGWMNGNNPRMPGTADSREILVKSVEAGSPADGVLQPYDIILGVATMPDGEPERFVSDARYAFAAAITLAESTAGGGALPLLRWRDGEITTVTLQIPVMGDYAASVPADCPKSQRIVEQAAAQVAGYLPAMGDHNMTGAINGLLLLATGDARYLDPVRRTAVRLANEPFSDAGHNTWRWGYVNLFLTEYYLATGDARVLPRIEKYSRAMAEGQCNPGTWGHRSVEGRIPPGYGSMNQAGLIAFMSLITARQIGIPFDQMAIAHSIDFYGSYAGRGSIPYGDHAPGNCSSDNGKNGSAAVAFHLLGAEPVVQWFAHLAASTNVETFDGGHTGNFFNQFWTPLGAALSGPQNLQNFWARVHSYRDLARRWDGTFITQPEPHVREGCLGFHNYTRKGPEWTTAAFALSYLGNTQTLAMLGRTRSVFAADAPEALEPALAFFEQQQFEDARLAARALAEDPDPIVRELADQLDQAASRNLRSLALTLADMQKNLEEGDFFLLRHQLQAIESLLDPDDSRLADFRAAVDDPAHADTMQWGEQYHRLVGGYEMLGRQGFVSFAPRPHLQTNQRAHDTLETMARDATGFYQEQAQRLLDAQPARLESEQVELVPKLEVDQPQLEHAFQVDDPAEIEELVLTWDLNVGGGMRVLLNGTTIMNISIDPGPWRNVRDTPIPLKATTLELLQPGENVLAVEMHPDRNVTEASLTLDAWQTL